MRDIYRGLKGRKIFEKETYGDTDHRETLDTRLNEFTYMAYLCHEKGSVIDLPLMIETAWVQEGDMSDTEQVRKFFKTKEKASTNIPYDLEKMIRENECELSYADISELRAKAMESLDYFRDPRIFAYYVSAVLYAMEREGVEVVDVKQFADSLSSEMSKYLDISTAD